MYRTEGQNERYMIKKNSDFPARKKMKPRVKRSDMDQYKTKVALAFLHISINLDSFETGSHEFLWGS